MLKAEHDGQLPWSMILMNGNQTVVINSLPTTQPQYSTLPLLLRRRQPLLQSHHRSLNERIAYLPLAPTTSNLAILPDFKYTVVLTG